MTAGRSGRLLLVLPSHRLVRRAVEAGFRVWAVCDPGEVDADFLPALSDAAEQVFFVDASDHGSLRRLVARAVGVYRIGVVLHCGGGSSVLPVVGEAWRLGVSPNPPEVLARLAPCGEGLSGRERRVYVESLTVGGRHHVLGVSAPRGGESAGGPVTGYVQPAPLVHGEQVEVERVVRDWLEAGGYRFGPAFSEVVLTDAGVRVVACEPRTAPDRIPLLTYVARGLDPEAALFAALAGTAPSVPPPQRCAELGFFLLPEGELLTFTGTEEIAVSPWVRGARFPYSAGDRIPPAGSALARRCYVVVEGDSPRSTALRMERARAELVADIRA